MKEKQIRKIVRDEIALFILLDQLKRSLRTSIKELTNECGLPAIDRCEVCGKSGDFGICDKCYEAPAPPPATPDIDYNEPI